GYRRDREPRVPRARPFAPGSRAPLSARSPRGRSRLQRAALAHGVAGAVGPPLPRRTRLTRTTEAGGEPGETGSVSRLAGQPLYRHPVGPRARDSFGRTERDAETVIAQDLLCLGGVILGPPVRVREVDRRDSGFLGDAIAARANLALGLR